MGKKKSKKKAAPELSKKERKALEAREAELAAEIERRERKASKKKGGKKAKGKSPKPSPVAEPAEIVDAGALGVMTIEAEAHVDGGTEEPEPAAEPEKPRHPHLAHLDRVGELIAIVNDESAKPKKREKAKAELAKLRAEGERLNAERDAKLAAEDAETKKRVQAKRAAREAEKVADVKAARMPDALEGETEADYQMRKLREKRDAEKVAELKPKVDAIRQATEAVETETGRIFETGVDKGDDIALPSEAGPELEEGRNGYKIIQLGADGKPDPRKVRQMTRVTTFVGNIDDETTLKKWEKRKVIEGLALDATAPESEGLIPKINELVHRRDVAISKAIKADRKGKLGVGEVGDLIAAAEKAAKDALDEIHERAAELAGRHAKANAGTHLHALAEISDEKGIDAVREMHESGETVHNDESGEDVPVTETDVASIEAYAAKMAALGAKVMHSEAVIVNDDLGYAGRLDRVILAKLPELTLPDGTVRPADQRARRYVADIKSGRVDLGAGKISRQLAAYALGDLYDLETGERSRHSAARDVALVFHLPQGKGSCALFAVDLKAGAALLKLSAEVRRGRNTGRKVMTAADILDGGE